MKLNSIVELLIIDDRPDVNSISHPFHLHGYKLYVMDMGQDDDGNEMTVELAQSIINTRRKLRQSAATNLPVKDTISIPSKGNISYE